MNDAPLRLVFAGTPDFAAGHLKSLIESEHSLLAVYTQPDRPAGRGRKLQASPVKKLAQAHAIPVRQPASLRDPAEQQALAELDADLMVVVAYGLILPPAILAAPARGCINVHASILPRWRGAAPIQRAIEAGDPVTGVTIMQMDAGLDTGDMLATATCAIAGHDAGSLQDELAGLGPPLLLQVLDQLAAHQRQARAQPATGATYAHKIDKSEGLLDWRRGADELERQVRAFTPFPGCFTFLDAERIKLQRVRALSAAASAAPGTITGTVTGDDRDAIVVACGSGQLAIEHLQLPGGKALQAAQVLRARARQFATGRQFSPAPTGAQE